MSYMSRFSVALATALLMGGAVGLAQAQAPDGAPLERSERFERALAAIDVVPDPRRMRQAIPDVRERLEAAARQPDRPRYERKRAITLMSGYPDDRTRASLRELASHADPDIRRAALYTLARTFGQPGDAALVARVMEATRDPDEGARRWAVRALRWIEHPEAGRALRELMRAEDASTRELAEYVLGRRAQRFGEPAR